MPWNSSTEKITGAVGISDIQTALNSNLSDIGGLIQYGVSNGKINKWAKWKPLKSTNPTMTAPVLHMNTDDQRKNAGRTSLYDTALVYGVRGGVSYISDTILDMHNRSFVYEAPSGASGEVYRFSDFVCPEDVSSSHQYGYKKGATCNLSGEAYKWGSNIERIYIGTPYALYVNLTYATRSNNYEEINIEDFFHSSVTIRNCYPCILITTATGYSYIHCLYPYNTTTLTTLGGHTQGTAGASWRLDLSDSTTVPSELQQNGVNWTWSVFLSSSRYLVANNQSDISTWVTVKEPGGSEPGDSWQSDLIGVPDLVGLTWQASSNDLPYFYIDSITANSDGNGFLVSGHFGSDYTRPDTTEDVIITISVDLYAAGTTDYNNNCLGSMSHQIFISENPSSQVAWNSEFFFDTDFGMMYPGYSVSYLVRANAAVGYMALTPTTSPYYTETITYSAQ